MVTTKSDPNRTLEVLAGGNDFATVIMAAMTADMMRALQLATIAAFGMGLRAQGEMASAHALPGGGSLSLGYGHGRLSVIISSVFVRIDPRRASR